jgi:hypothetical protein
MWLGLMLPGAAWAQGYGESGVVAAFRDRPCGEVLEVIYLQEATGLTFGETIGVAGTKNLYLGFVVGFDAAHGGLHTEAQTTLARLREACAASPEATALSLLEAFVAERDGGR